MSQPTRADIRSIKYLCFMAALIALFVVMDLLSIRINNNIKITFGGLPILVAALCFGPVSGLIVGLLGSFTGQLLSYGLTLTTPLWILPAGVRGLSMGLMMNAFTRAISRLGGQPARGLSALSPFMLRLCAVSVAVLISSLLVTAFNTLAMYVDSKLYGYYTYALVFGVTAFRLVQGVLTSACFVLLLMPIDAAFKKLYK